VLKTRPRAVRRLLLLHGKLEPPAEFLEMAEAAGIAPEILGWEEFLREGDFQEEENHQGVCLFARQRELLAEKDLKSLAGARVVLALDQLSDPRNLGAILRGAAFFGVDAVLLLKNRAAPITPAVTRIAVGGAEFVKIFEVTNLARSLDLLKKLGFWVFGLDERGEKSLVEADFGEKAVLVIGAEGEGLRQRTAEFCDELVKIPGGRAGVESLNAAVAATIALAEVFRGGSARGTVG
jgi:23S rRNA (guanosine2251-2'-O)-methyltransferase